MPVENGIISPEVAKITAELFIRDARMALPELDWVEDTQVDNIVTMYDENGNISAYSCELVTNDSQSGYIVIAAYADSASDILEFSDEVQPVYYELDDSLKTKSHIIYTGNMNYFLDIGDDTVTDIYNNKIKKSSIDNTLKKLKTGIEPYTLIDDPYEYADSKYDGPFVHDESKNKFEKYCNYWTTKDYATGENCGPTAITNLLRMVGEYQDNKNVTSKTDSEIYQDVVEIGIQNSYYSGNEGTYRATSAQYVQVCFNDYGMNATVKNKSVSYDAAKTEIDNDRLFYLSLWKHDNYGTHAVACFAYARLKSSSTGYYKSFLKIADGWVHSGRYLDMSDLESDDNIMRTIKIR